MTMEFWDVVEGRHATRDFKTDAVSVEVLGRVMHAAASAPSAMNAQPWRFHVCTGDSRAEIGRIVSQTTVHLTEYMDVLGPKRYEDAVGWYSSLGNAPVVIGVSAPVTDSEFDETNTLLSIGAAMENLMLAAASEGLGSCPITFAWWVRDELGRLFGLGEDRSVVAIIAMGHPGIIPAASPPKREDVADYLV
ncbi:MAG: nitroreductase family protein [Actinobacteria bacterium]|nr:MAG: nitroreductase family protein [Actinomycetota bacterium]